MRVSVSQIKNFRLCPTKWYISSILKIKEPEKKATKLGTDFHTAAGHYLRGNVPDIKEAKLANMLENAKPELQPYMMDKPLIEQEIRGELCEGITYLGYIDILTIDKEVVDLKTGNPDYFLTEHQLTNDLQLNIYAHHEFMASDSNDPAEYRITHIQQSTKAPFMASRISAQVDSSKFHKIWTEAQETALDMKSVADNAKDLPWEDIDRVLHKEKSACSKYGGCPYQEVCWHGINPEYLRKQLASEAIDMLPENHPFTEGNSDMDNKTSFAEKLAKAKGEKPPEVDMFAEPTPEMLAKANKMKAEAEKRLTPRESKEDRLQDYPDGLNKPKEPEKTKRKPGRPKKEKTVAAIENDEFNEKMVEAGVKKLEDLEDENIPKQTQFCLGAIPFKSGIQITQFSDILKPFEDKLAGELGMTDIREHKFNEPTKTLCKEKKKIMEKCKGFEYVFVDERDPVQDLLFRCMDTGDYIVWRGVR